MVKLTGIFKLNTRIGSMVEIVKEVMGVKTYILIHEDNIKIEGETIYIHENTINRLSWFFKKIRSIF